MDVREDIDSWVIKLDEAGTYPLKNPADLDPLLARIGDARCVMLGEASHGTHEYYTWRSAITKRLIEEKGFNFIAVEGDWPDCYRINRYIKGFADQDKTSEQVLHEFGRWPTWLWANWEIASLTDWLKLYNSDKAADKRVGFYGLDVYSLWESMEALVKYLDKNDPEAAKFAREAVRCFEPFEEDPVQYARSQYSMGSSCKQAVVKLLTEIRSKAPIYDHDPEAALNTEQNAHIAVNAEEYYTSLVGFNNNAWNLRDTHMMETLHRLFEFHGDDSKVIVWEHNSHIGDARYTNMLSNGLHNTGQLAREQLGEDQTVLVGFGSYEGTVIAGKHWDASMEVMTVPEAREGSAEGLMHFRFGENRLLVFDRRKSQDRDDEVLSHRAIGVVYNPQNEKHSNYVPTKLRSRYDAFLYLDKTTALHPLGIKPDGKQVPDTYPFNF